MTNYSNYQLYELGIGYQYINKEKLSEIMVHKNIRLFIIGYFAKCLKISYNDLSVNLRQSDIKYSVLQFLQFNNIDYTEKTKEQIIIKTDELSLLSIIYNTSIINEILDKNIPSDIRLLNIIKSSHLYNRYQIKSNYYNYLPFKYSKDIIVKMPQCKYNKFHNDAVMPYKKKGSDIGYNLTIIQKVKYLSNDIMLFNTGISITPDDGYYFEVLPKRSLLLAGYVMTQSSIVIDPSHNAPILITLKKINDDIIDLQLPFTGCQLILRKIHTCEFTETTE